MSIEKNYFNINYFSNISNWTMPLQNFSFFDTFSMNYQSWNFDFNNSILNPNYLKSFQQSNFSSTNNWTNTNFINNWNYSPPALQFNNFNTQPTWGTFSSPPIDTFTSTIASSSPTLSLQHSSDSKIKPKLNIQTRTYGSLQEKYYKTALSYVGTINSDKAGNAEFSNGRDEAWCADMVTTIAHRVFGNKLPEGMPDGRKGGVASKSLAKWADRHNRWLEAPNSGLANYIAQNVKPGDIVILDRGGASGHAAIVTAVHSDGTFETVEGNAKNSVKTRTRPPKIDQPYGSGTNKLMGFVQMGDIA